MAASCSQLVDVTKAAELVKSGVRFVDVRTPQEFAAGHVETSINVPFMLAAPGGGALYLSLSFLPLLTASRNGAQQRVPEAV